MKKTIATLILIILISFIEPINGIEPETPQNSSINEALQCPYIYHTVNVITGEYCENETDLQLSGPGSLSFRRCYTTQDPIAQGWHFNHPNILFYDDDPLPASSDSPIHYEFDEKNQLKTIAIKSAQGDILYHKLHLEYKDMRELNVTSESGSSVRYTFQKVEPSRTLHPYLLESVQTSGGLDISYEYIDHPVLRKKLLAKRGETDGRYLITEYYDSTENDVEGTIITITDPCRDNRIGRVKLQKAPVGVDATPHITTRLFYEPGHTVVYDAMNNKTIYRYGKNRKLTAIENHLEEGELYRIERFFWNDCDQLISRSIEDAAGNVQNCQTFVYDLWGNILKQSEYGSLTGTRYSPLILDKQGLPFKNGVECYSTVYRYSDDDHNLLLYQMSDNGAATRYQYESESDRLEAIFTYDHTTLQIRQFYHYDEAGQLVEAIVDDGDSEDPDCLKGVTERKITRLQLRETAPAIGMPEVIEESYLNLDTGSEELFQETRLTYTAKNEVSRKEIYDACGKCKEALNHEYDEGGRLIRTTDLEGNVTEATYDSHGNLLSSTTDEVQIYNQYDFSNRLIHSKETSESGLKQQTTHRYDYAGNKISSTDIFGNETLFEYDALGRCVKILSPMIKDTSGGVQRPTISQAYDIMDRVISTTDGNGLTTTTTYNARGKPTTIIYADGSHEWFGYNLDGTLNKSIAKNGVYTIYSYDFLSRIIREDIYTEKGEHLYSNSKTYSAFHLLSETDRGGRITTYQYDGAGRQIAITKDSDNGTLRTKICYDAQGQVEKRSDWYGTGDGDFSTAAIERDAHNDISAINIQDYNGKTLKRTSLEKDESPIKPLYNYNHYNELGQNVLQVTTTNDQGCTTITTFNALNLPEKIERKNSLGHLLSSKELIYDAAGNKVREIHQTLRTNNTPPIYACAWTYGPNRRLESVTEGYGTPQAKTTLYTYYQDGTLESTTKPDGVALIYKYTPTGKIVRLTSSDSTIDYSYQYDALDRPIEIRDKITGTGTFRTYDDRDNLIHEQLGNGLCLDSKYDLHHRRTELTLPDTSTVSYTYNAAYLTSIKRCSPQKQTLYTHRYTRYNLQGKLTETRGIGNSGTLSYDYDEKNRLTTIQSPNWTETIHYNDLGNITLTDVKDPSGTTTNTFQYEDRQLTQETGTANNTYTYDSIANRTSKNDAEYLVDPLNQLTAAGDTLYTYDINGNLLTKKHNAPPIRYKYDALNRLVEATQERSFKLSFSYDAYNRRLSKTSCRWNSSTNQWRQTGHHRYLYDGNNEIGAVDPEGKLQELRVLGSGLGAEIGAAVAIELNGALYAPIHDHRGSVCCLIDATTGQAEEWYRYSAFGEESFVSGTKNPWRFSSKRIDEKTGLVFFGNRYYDSDIGRWITQDPLGTLDGINRYAFVHNQPLNQIDLYGLFTFKDFCQSLWGWTKSFYSFMNISIHNLQNRYSFFNYIRPTMDKILPQIIGLPILYLAGYYKDKSEIGVHGKGELNDKVRITLINGILNARTDYKLTLDTISESHGGVNIHYIFDASDGWTWDILKALLAKSGYKSKQAYQLVETWRTLIEEMGGVDGGGTIIHYAHSIGGVHTQTALNMLTPEERKMIHIYTFGSATMIPDSGMETIINFISVRDVIMIADPLGFLYGLLGWREEIHPVGNWLGIPLVDHMIGSKTYLTIIHFLGKQFLHLYAAGENY